MSINTASISHNPVISIYSIVGHRDHHFSQRTELCQLGAIQAFPIFAQYSDLCADGEERGDLIKAEVAVGLRAGAGHRPVEATAHDVGAFKHRGALRVLTGVARPKQRRGLTVLDRETDRLVQRRPLFLVGVISPAKRRIGWHGENELHKRSAQQRDPLVQVHVAGTRTVRVPMASIRVRYRQWPILL